MQHGNCGELLSFLHAASKPSIKILAWRSEKESMRFFKADMKLPIVDLVVWCENY